MVYAASPALLTRRLTISILAATCLVAGCRRQLPREEPTPLAVELSGCAAVLRGEGGRVTCELGEARAVRVILPDGAPPPSVVVEGPSGATSLADAGSAFDVPKGVSRLVVRAGAGEWSVAVADVTPLPWLETARLARAKGDLAGARAALGGHEDDPRATSLLARVALAEGSVEASFPLFRRAIDAHRARGRTSDAADDSFALAFALHQRSHRYAEARAVLDAAKADLGGYPDGAAREPYYRGILAAEVGDRRAASMLLREAERRATRLGLAKLARNARAALALELVALGRGSEGRELLRALERDPEVRGCERAETLNNLGWVLLEGDEGRASGRAAARGYLEGATGVTCSDPFVASGALANLAALDLEGGAPGAASARLAEARARVREPRGTERLAWLDLDGRIALAEKRPRDALARFDEAIAVAKDLLLTTAEWSAHVGRAEALAALARDADVVLALERAEALLDRASLLVPLGGGRETFLGARDRGAKRHVEVLVRRGRTEEAANVARRSRARVLLWIDRALRIARLAPDERASWERSVTDYRAARRALDAEATRDWSLPASDLLRVEASRKAKEEQAREALERAIAALEGTVVRTEAPPRPAAGELELLLFPTPDAWLALVADGSRVTAHPLGALDTSATKSAIVAAIAARGGLRATRLRVLAYGASRDIDVQALATAEGAPLGDLVPVEYSLGLGAARPAARSEDTALVVGDPTKDLPMARREAELVASSLRGTGRRVTTLLGKDVTSAAVASALPGVGTLHYAGHAVYDDQEVLASALPLEGGARLTVGDLLALPGAPRTVVLSACEAARSGGASEGLGLAQAFVVAGADAVLAPVRPVADDMALALARALYTHQTDAGVTSLSARARDALRVVRVEMPRADWSAYRVLTR